MSAQQSDPATLEILWERLISIADEMAGVIVRTSFSTAIAAANDFACEIMDAQGRPLAHAARSMPVFNQTMPVVTRAVLDKYGPTMRPGDVFITNDPWLNAGHSPDIAVVSPVFAGDRLVATIASVAHAADIGGTLDNDSAQEVFEEGLLIPICHLSREGQLDDTVVRFIRENVRVPDGVMGDILAQAAANETGARAVCALLAEYAMDDLSDLADSIHEYSSAAMRRAIEAVPDGTYTGEVEVRERDEPIVIRCAVTVNADTVRVNFSGSSTQQERGGVNCTLTYTRGQTSYGLKCLLLPEVASNSGVYEPLQIHASEGSILNARKPASVEMRTRTGWYIHHALFEALADVIPDQIMAPAGMLSAWIAYCTDPHTGETSHAWFFNGGGMGAGSSTDGVSTCIYPSSASTVSAELFEVAVPLVVEEKRLVTDSGGPGRRRGGLGQRVTISRLPTFSGQASLSLWLHGRRTACGGVRGGHAGAEARVEMTEHQGSGPTIVDTGHVRLRDAHTKVTQVTSGGGGYGTPSQRPRAALENDVANEYVSTHAAESTYRSERTVVDAESM